MPQDSRKRGWLLAAAATLAAVLPPGISLAGTRQWHAVPVAGGTDAVCAAVGLEPGLPAWRVLFEATRRRELWGEHTGREGGARPAAAPAAQSARVALPLAPSLWRRLLGRDDVPDDQLALAILADRRSSLLYRALAAFDEPTLAALAAEPETLGRIHQRHADTLAALGGRFRLREGVVDVPGGAEGEALWGELLGVGPREPVRFLLALLEGSEGRRALLYDAVARLDPLHQRFALGMQHPPGAARVAALRDLAAVFDRERDWWRREKGAFARPPADAARLLREVRLGADGSMAPPAAQVFWEAVFDGSVVGGAEWPEAVRSSPPADAAWLAGRMATGDTATSVLRFEQVVFAQRVFDDVPPGRSSDAALALRSLRDARALLLALERMGTRDTALYAAAARVAAGAGPGSGEAASLHRVLQGSLGVIDRARFAGTLDVSAAERLVRSLLDVSAGGQPPARAVASWAERELLPQLARAVYGAIPPGDPETTVLRAMAGDRADGQEDLLPFDWEGLRYRADPARSGFVRLERVRARQGTVPLEVALRLCRSPSEGGERPCAGALGPALTSLVYALHLGDPEGPALGGEDPSLRHDFASEPWALPEEVWGEGVPWHVRGSLLGLEVTLARLSLQRGAGLELPDDVPVLDAPQRRALAASVGLLNPRDLTDADRDAIAAAIEAGRRRAAALRTGGPDVEAAGRDAGLDPWRVRALEWLLEHEPSAAGSFFSLGELLRLGAPGEERWDAWGVADELVGGLRPRLPRPLPLDETSGRKPEAALAEVFCDLNLRVAAHLAGRRLPACLAPALVSTLLADLLAESRPVAPDDRLGLDAWVRAQPRERLDGTFASLAVRGILQPVPAPGGAP
jgi:hypothetical protein